CKPSPLISRFAALLICLSISSMWPFFMNTSACAWVPSFTKVAAFIKRVDMLGFLRECGSISIKSKDFIRIGKMQFGKTFENGDGGYWLLLSIFAAMQATFGDYKLNKQ